MKGPCLNSPPTREGTKEGMNTWRRFGKKSAGCSALFLALCFLSAQALADKKPALLGLAHVEWNGKNRYRTFDAAIRIEDKTHAIMDVLDDFGNRVMRIEVTGQKTWMTTDKRRPLSDRKFKKTLSL